MDTVIIKIYGPGKFKLTKRDWFLPELKKRTFDDLSETEKQASPNRQYLRKFTLMPKVTTGQYVPSVEVFERLSEDRKSVFYTLKIQLSAPKLLYGNSLQEVVESDRDALFNKLRSVLLTLGIEVGTDAIAGATVSAVHFCKNLPLPRNMYMREIQNELGQMDITKAEDVSDKQMKNGGRVLVFFSGTVEHAFYDKISDCLRPKNKRTDKGFIDPERDVVTLNGLQGHEVCRYEYRLKKNQTVRREINRFLNREATKGVYFRDLFAQGTFQGIVLKAWRSLVDRPENQLSLFGESSRLRVFLHVLANAKKMGGNSGHTMNGGLSAYGLIMAVRDHGAKEVKGIVSEMWNNDHPERFREKLAYAVHLTEGLELSTNIAFIEEGLSKFKRVDVGEIKQ